MVFNGTVNNISATFMDLLQVPDTLYHKIKQAYLAMSGIRTHNFSGYWHWLHRQI